MQCAGSDAAILLPLRGRSAPSRPYHDRSAPSGSYRDCSTPSGPYHDPSAMSGPYHDCSAPSGPYQASGPVHPQMRFFDGSENLGKNATPFEGQR